MSAHVVIVNFNSADLARACVASLRGEELASIVILDNASTTDQREILGAVSDADSRVTLHFSTVNEGFGAGVNRAIDLLSAHRDDVVWVLNPDMDVVPGALRVLSRAIADGADVVSPLILQPDRAGFQPRVWFAGGTISLKSGVVRHAMPRPEDLIAGSVMSTSFMTGAAPLMTLATWQKVGGFRDDLFMYWEDVDWSLRATTLGLRMCVATDARVVHSVGGSSEQGSGKSSLYYHYVLRNRLVVCVENGSSIAGLLIGKGARETLRLTVRTVVVESAGRGSKLFAALSGIFSGVRMAREMRRRSSGTRGTR